VNETFYEAIFIGAIVSFPWRPGIHGPFQELDAGLLLSSEVPHPAKLEWGALELHKLRIKGHKTFETTLFLGKGKLLMKKLLLYGVSATILLVGASGAGSYLIDLSPGRGPTRVYDQAIFIEVTEAMQASLSSATGVIDSFLRMQKKTPEKEFNSSAFPVFDATRPLWHSFTQITDLFTTLDLPRNYKILSDINEHAGNKYNSWKRSSQKMDTAFMLPTSLFSGDSLYEHAGNKYGSWKESAQKMDTAFMLPTSLLSGDSLNDHVNLYTQFGTLGHLIFPSQAGFGEDAPREPGTSVPEPTTMLLLGIGLVGLSVLGRKELIR
jgi:hypothetical protein